MFTSNATRTQLLTAAFVALTAVATWSITTIVHPDVQLTVKSGDHAAPGSHDRAAIADQRSRG